eukprot:TRINITY_DN8808_c0_g1_i1.p1 TRINITY_DN8808_c0_g1~~TRINITY_DN8808_c0_g1_i1.p1  ORF type:complete len:134 (-),score=5.11 TRINITY_DN8808_c0_g1_i1:527-928(-)
MFILLQVVSVLFLYRRVGNVAKPCPNYAGVGSMNSLYPFRSIIIIKALSQLCWGRLLKFCFSIPIYLESNSQILSIPIYLESNPRKFVKWALYLFSFFPNISKLPKIYLELDILRAKAIVSVKLVDKYEKICS